MVNKKHKYKVVNSHGAVFVTFGDLASAEQFIKNAVARCGPLRLMANGDHTL